VVLIEAITTSRGTEQIDVKIGNLLIFSPVLTHVSDIL
jgi:hypothetical protein